MKYAWTWNIKPECRDDAQASFDYVNNNEDCKRWNAITTKMIDTDFDGAIDSGIQYLHEAFYLE